MHPFFAITAQLVRQLESSDVTEAQEQVTVEEAGIWVRTQVTNVHGTTNLIYWLYVANTR